MLAYVFWHAPAQRAEGIAYEQALGAFHRALAATRPAGLVRSETHRLDSVPWVEGFPVYEDWYLLTDSAALDRLDEAAIGVGARATHDAIAARAGPGAGGLYKCLVEGSPPGAETTTEWLGKPPAAPYPAFIAALQSEIPPGGWLWQRKMVLAPAPEFCLVRPGRGAAASAARLYLRQRLYP